MRSRTAPRSTLVVKLTFAYDERGVIAPSEDAAALEGDVASRYGDETELERPNDFVGPRPGVDVVLVGSAYAAHPTTIIGAAIGVDRWSRGFFACSSVPATRIPLVKAYLRGDANPNSAPIRVGPAASPATNEDRADPCGPAEQHLESITSTSRIVLVGLGRGATILDLALPGLEPRLFVTTAGAPAEEPALRCDTLLVDTDRRVVTLTYRTTLADAAWARGMIVLAADWPDDRLVWRAVERQLPRASRLTAIEHAEREAPGTSPGAFVPASTTIASEEDQVDPLIETHLHRVDPRDIKPALPFVPAPRAARPFAPGPDTSTVEGRRAPASTADLPFNKPEMTLSPLTKPSPGGAIRPDRTLGSQSNEEHRAIQAATRAALPPIAIVSAPRPAPLRTIAPIAEELSLERFAAVKAALAETGASLPQILAGHGIDAEAWHAAERRHVELVTREAKEGRSDRARAFLEAVTAARSRIAANPGKNLERGGS